METNRKKLAVITESSSDLMDIVRKNKIEHVVFQPGQIDNSLNDFDAIAILGGTSDKPMILHPRERNLVEVQIKKGKKVFAEYCASIGNLYFEPPASTRYERLVFSSNEAKLEGVEPGDLLDDQCGMKLKPYPAFTAPNPPILLFASVHSHSRVDNVDELKNDIAARALWFDRPDNLLVCSFRMVNFIRARYAPKGKFRELVRYILEWLLDTRIDMEVLPHHYENKASSSSYSEEAVLECAEKALQWFQDSGILLNKGKDGVMEGLGTEIYPNGSQKVNSLIRTDCVGEVSMVYFMDYLLKGSQESLDISNRLAGFCFDYMLCREDSYLHGMMRWTEEAWGVCYQDDVARAIIPQLLKCLYTGTNDHLEDCVDALRFLLKTTGSDGTRVFRTDNVLLDEEAVKELAEKPGDMPSAHYNGYYYAAMLLTYKLTGIEEFKEAGIKGLEAIMAVYPDTKREQSQTQEYCRLILPLSWLYWVTEEEKHREWLYRVTRDLQVFRHPSGAYLEWDEGYKAKMRNTGGTGECSLLAANGDPVVDLLYSNNWLPIGFIQAYLVTDDEWFLELWKDTARFMISAQIHSKDSLINGAWARGFDVDLMEVSGSPADAGWGPWALESGCTVAEIASGLMMGLARNQLKKAYK
jgi:hypothetical protein